MNLLQVIQQQFDLFPEGRLPGLELKDSTKGVSSETVDAFLPEKLLLLLFCNTKLLIFGMFVFTCLIDLLQLHANLL